jgi:hypothetical protein
MKKWLWLFLTVIVLAVTFLLLRGNEDNWIRDSRGVWIKHGNPSKTPSQVLDQQNAIEAANALYINTLNTKDLSAGPCLGTVENIWSVDIAHNPRRDIDNKTENQCRDYIDGKTTHFIELDDSGAIIKVK